MRNRSTAIPPPVVGVVVPDTHSYGHVERRRLAVPTVIRRASRWEDEPDEVRAEVRAAAIEQLTFKLQTARRVLVNNPGLNLAVEIDKLERALAAAERLQ